MKTFHDDRSAARTPIGANNPDPFAAVTTATFVPGPNSAVPGIGSSKRRPSKRKVPAQV
jgi:hypothetical protein